MIAEAKPRQQARRAAILNEAIRMLGKHGYNGLTVQALAERCDISNAGLLYYFGSKDELLLAVLDEFELREREIMTPLVERAELRRDDPAAARQAFVALQRAMVQRFMDRPDMARFSSRSRRRQSMPHTWRTSGFLSAHAWHRASSKPFSGAFRPICRQPRAYCRPRCSGSGSTGFMPA